MAENNDSDRGVLGCGAIILLALIALFVTRPGVTDLERDVRELRSEVGDLKKAVDAQTNEIKRVTEALTQKRPAEDAGRQRDVSPPQK